MTQKETEIKPEFVQPQPSYKIGNVIRYVDADRGYCTYYGEITEIRITKSGITYRVQDENLVSEKNVRAVLYECPF